MLPYLALTSITAGLVLFDRLCPKMQVSGPTYTWSTPLRVLALTAVGLISWGAITLSLFPPLG